MISAVVRDLIAEGHAKAATVVLDRAQAKGDAVQEHVIEGGVSRPVKLLVDQPIGLSAPETGVWRTAAIDLALRGFQGPLQFSR